MHYPTILVLAIGIAGVGCAQRSVTELASEQKDSGQYWRYCELAKHSVETDRSLLVAVAECYEHGWGELPRDQALAVNYYEQGARWGVPEAIAALNRLGVSVPATDLLHTEHEHLDEMRSAELKHALLLAVVGTEMSIDRHPAFKPASGTLGPRPGTDIASSPAFARYLRERAQQGAGPPCALVYVKGHRIEPGGACR